MKTSTQIKTRNIHATKIDGFADAEREARTAAGKEIKGASLLAFFDRQLRISGPAETCNAEGKHCPAAYARSHGAALKVDVNAGAYEFYFGATPLDARTLDPEQVLAIHRDLAQNRFENVQGG